MKRAYRTVVLLTIVLIAASAVRASTLKVQGGVSGIELCQQSVCGKAIFAGLFKGQVGNNPNAFGTIAVGVKHDDLPVLKGQCSDITGGSFVMWVGLRKLTGGTVGDLCYNGDLTYTVTVQMDFDATGYESSTFIGTLDHTKFPPTIDGVIF